jgi:hypothetical protein
MRRCLTMLVASALGCGLTNYQKAATQFGNSTAAGVTAAREVVGDAHETCRIRAWIHAVEGRFQVPDFPRNQDPLALSSGVSSSPGKTLTWRQYCERQVDYDRALMGALAALDAYANALRNAAAGDRIALDTDLTGALASDANELAQQAGSSAFAGAKELSAPVTALVNVVLDLVRTQELRLAVRKGKQPVTAILAGIRAYLAAAKDQLVDAQRLTRQLVRNADAIIPVRQEGQAIPRELPGQALALYEFTRLETERLDVLEGRIGATGDLVQALEEAHAELVKGAEASVTDAAVRDFVSAKAQAIVKQVNILRKLNGRG